MPRTPAPDYQGAEVAVETPTAPVFAPPSTSGLLNKAAWDLIVEFEISSASPTVYARSKYRFPIWPGGSSGITWGIGYDGGYNTRSSILRDWQKLTGIERLANIAGIKGKPAKAQLTTVNDILVPWDLAVEVFDKTSVPKFYQAMLRTFPGADALNVETQGALTSMVYNRGPSLVGDSRVDLRTIAKAVPKKDYKAIAAALRQMNVTMGPKWRAQNVYAGLSRRRIAEAEMVEESIGRN